MLKLSKTAVIIISCAVVGLMTGTLLAYGRNHAATDALPGFSTEQTQSIKLVESIAPRGRVNDNEKDSLALRLASEDAKAVRLALGAVMEIKDSSQREQYLPRVLECVSHSDGEVRATAVVTLWKWDHKDWKTLAEKQLKDQDEFVRWSAEDLMTRGKYSPSR